LQTGIAGFLRHKFISRRVGAYPWTVRIAKTGSVPRVKYWEIIADSLSKAAWSWAVSQRLIPTGERSGLLTPIAATENVSLCERMKSWLRLWNLNQRFEPLRIILT